MKKQYVKPELKVLGNMIRITLSGGSQGAEGSSGKGSFSNP